MIRVCSKLCCHAIARFGQPTSVRQSTGPLGISAHAPLTHGQHASLVTTRGGAWQQCASAGARKLGAYTGAVHVLPPLARATHRRVSGHIATWLPWGLGGGGPSIFLLHRITKTGNVRESVIRSKKILSAKAQAHKVRSQETLILACGPTASEASPKIGWARAGCEQCRHGHQRWPQPAAQGVKIRFVEDFAMSRGRFRVPRGRAPEKMAVFSPQGRRGRPWMLRGGYCCSWGSY